MRKPKWWDKPITWGSSIKMSLWSIPISLLLLLITDLCTGSYGYVEILCDKATDAKEWMSDLFDK